METFITILQRFMFQLKLLTLKPHNFIEYEIVCTCTQWLIEQLLAQRRCKNLMEFAPKACLQSTINRIPKVYTLGRTMAVRDQGVCVSEFYWIDTCVHLFIHLVYIYIYIEGERWKQCPFT